MKARMSDSSFHAVHVQKVRLTSFKIVIPRFPGDRFACVVDLKA